ncbi:MAG: 30S ribosomal protein S6 [Planctomycetota bacterium]
MNQYEAMFVFDPTFGASFEECEKEIRRIMDRAQAEIVLCRRWDERRLAYKIKGRKRGVYVLVFFKAPMPRISGLERDARLSEHILRMLVLRADEVTPEAMEKAYVIQVPERTEDDGRFTSSRGSGRGGRGHGGFGGGHRDDRMPAGAGTVASDQRGAGSDTKG